MILERIWRIGFGQCFERRVPGSPDPRVVEYVRADLAAEVGHWVIPEGKCSQDQTARGIAKRLRQMAGEPPALQGDAPREEDRPSE